MATMHEFDKYRLILQDTGRVEPRYNKSIVKYTFINPDGVVLFEGSDFYPSSMIEDVEGIESAKTLLGFLTCQLGDVDEEYFDNYTEDQKAFRDSLDCEFLKIYTFEE